MNRQDIANTIIILIPVFVCILVFFLPLSWQEKLLLDMNNLSYWNWFTYIFVHVNFIHLFMNILIYLVAMIYGYILLDKEDRKKLNLIILILLVLIPGITFIATQYFKSINLLPIYFGITQRGFSGITSGALGILGFAISRKFYLSTIKERSIKNLLNWSYYVFLPSLAIMVYNLSWKCSLIVGFVWVFFLATWMIPILIKLKKSEGRKSQNPINTKSIIMPLFILLLGMLLLVPKNIVSEGSAINILAHFLGYIIAFFISFIIIGIFGKR